VVLDMDSTEIPVYGEPEQSAYNGHFESRCYQPLLLFHREGIVWRPSCGPATSTAPRVGRNCGCRRWIGNRSRASRRCSGPGPEGAPALPAPAG